MFSGKPNPFPDTEQLPEIPQRYFHHRRAHSETFLRLPDALLLDADLDLLDASMNMSVDSDSSAGPKNSPYGTSMTPSSTSTCLFRSQSVDDDFFEGLGLENDTKSPQTEEKKIGRHKYSNSVDGSVSMAPFDVESSIKKTMAPERLAELSLIDPKRAKRILANRQSAARSKERKMHYTKELERKVRTLQIEAITLSAQVTRLQRDSMEFTTANKELKLRLQALEQQAQLRDALNEALREEVQRLRLATGELSTPNSHSLPHFPAHTRAAATPFSNSQSQPPQTQQQQAPRPSPTSHPRQNTFMNFSSRG